MQVLNELAEVSLRKLGLDADAVRRRIELYARLRLVPTEAEDLISALEIHRVHGFSWWDCLVLQAAKRAGCRVLYSEDLQHGFRLGPLEVVDPFRSPD
jgi:predicted nucleic acid-binding protein